MSLDISEIEKIAWLARLALAPEDIPEYSRDLSNILALVEQMKQVETGAVEPLAHPMEITARLRADQVTETDQRDKFQRLAPAVDGGHYLVPRVIE